MNLVLDTIEEVGPDREAIIEALADVKDHDSIVGPITFDDHGQNAVPLITKYVVQDGKWVVWEDSEYASGQAQARRPRIDPTRRVRGRLESAAAAGPTRLTRRREHERASMDLGLLGQFVVNGLMLGMMYALVAVGFTLFFGVLDVIKFSHGDVLTVGAFAGLSDLARAARARASPRPGCRSPPWCWSRPRLMALLGALIARFLVLPLQGRAGAQHPARSR